MSTRRVFRPPHALLVTRVSPNQSNAALLIGARAKNSQATSARHRSPGAARRRRQRQAHVPLPTSTSSPTRSTPGLSAQFLRTHHRRVRRGSSSYAAGFSGIRRAPLASAATHAFVAAAAGQRDDGARCRSDRRFAVLTSRAPSRTLPRRRASRARGAARQQIGRKRPRLLFSTCVACRSGCAGCTSRSSGGKPIGRCRRLLLLYASHTCANRVLMLRAARARCTG